MTLVSRENTSSISFIGKRTFRGDLSGCKSQSIATSVIVNRGGYYKVSCSLTIQEWYEDQQIVVEHDRQRYFSVRACTHNFEVM